MPSWTTAPWAPALDSGLHATPLGLRWVVCTSGRSILVITGFFVVRRSGDSCGETSFSDCVSSRGLSLCLMGSDKCKGPWEMGEGRTQAAATLWTSVEVGKNDSRNPLGGCLWSSLQPGAWLTWSHRPHRALPTTGAGACRHVICRPGTPGCGAHPHFLALCFWVPWASGEAT